MESNKAFTSICLLLCLILSTKFFNHCDARTQRGFKKESEYQSKKLMIKAIKHTSLLEKMMTQLNLAQPLAYSSSSNTQPYDVSTTLTLPPYVSLPPLSVSENSPPFCVNPPNSPASSFYPTFSPPYGPITLPNPHESSSNPNSNPNPNPPESSSNTNLHDYSPNPNSKPNPPESSSNPNPPDSSSNPNPPVTVSNPPESSSNPNPPVPVPYPPESSSPNPTVPSPPQPNYTIGPSGPNHGPPYNEPSPSTPTNTPTLSGGIPSPTESVPSPSSGFLPPIVYPPPMAPPSPSVTPTSAYWCMAKPTVPDPIIQEAMNFACGSGADCHSIQPSGPCYKPNTLWAQLLSHSIVIGNGPKLRVARAPSVVPAYLLVVTIDPSFNGCHFDFF